VIGGPQRFAEQTRRDLKVGLRAGPSLSPKSGHSGGSRWRRQRPPGRFRAWRAGQRLFRQLEKTWRGGYARCRQSAAPWLG